MPLNEHSWCTEFVSYTLQDDKGRQSWPSVVNRLSFQVGGPAVFFGARKMTGPWSSKLLTNLSDHTQTTPPAVSHRLSSKIWKKGKRCMVMELRWEELDSSLIGNGWVCHFNFGVDNGVRVCRMVCSQLTSLFFWGFERHAGRGKCLLCDGWSLHKKKEEEWVRSIRRDRSLQKQVLLQKQLESFGRRWPREIRRTLHRIVTHMCPESNTTILANEGPHRGKFQWQQASSITETVWSSYLGQRIWVGIQGVWTGLTCCKCQEERDKAH